jgi:hypothetical protein
MPDNTGIKQTTRFKRGQSGNPNGNPNGRPIGSRNKATLAVQALLEGESEAITRKAIELAKDGDITAIRLILERILPPRKDTPVSFELNHAKSAEDISEAMAAILRAVSMAELTPHEAQAIASLIEQQRRCIETVTLEQQLSQLENIIKKDK